MLFSVVGEGTPPSSASWSNSLRTSLLTRWRWLERELLILQVTNHMLVFCNNQPITCQDGWRFRLLVEIFFTARRMEMAMLIQTPSSRRSLHESPLPWGKYQCWTSLYWRFNTVLWSAGSEKMDDDLVSSWSFSWQLLIIFFSASTFSISVKHLNYFNKFNKRVNK